eukprot:g43989.t1
MARRIIYFAEVLFGTAVFFIVVAASFSPSPAASSAISLSTAIVSVSSFAEVTASTGPSIQGSSSSSELLTQETVSDPSTQASSSPLIEGRVSITPWAAAMGSGSPLDPSTPASASLFLTAASASLFLTAASVEITTRASPFNLDTATSSSSPVLTASVSRSPQAAVCNLCPAYRRQPCPENGLACGDCMSGCVPGGLGSFCNDPTCTLARIDQCRDYMRREPCSPCSLDCGACLPGYYSSLPMATCMEIDECQSVVCLNGGTCKDLFLNFSCDCTRLFSGDSANQPTLEMDILWACLPGCEQSGFGLWCNDPICTSARKDQCRDYMHREPCLPCSFDCNACLPGYYSLLPIAACMEIDECQGGVCLNGGTCTDKFLNFSCQCQQSFYGTFCELAYPTPSTTITPSVSTSPSTTPASPRSSFAPSAPRFQSLFQTPSLSPSPLLPSSISSSPFSDPLNRSGVNTSSGVNTGGCRLHLATDLDRFFFNETCIRHLDREDNATCRMQQAIVFMEFMMGPLRIDNWSMSLLGVLALVLFAQAGGIPNPKSSKVLDKKGKEIKWKSKCHTGSSRILFGVWVLCFCSQWFFSFFSLVVLGTTVGAVTVQFEGCLQMWEQLNVSRLSVFAVSTWIFQPVFAVSYAVLFIYVACILQGFKLFVEGKQTLWGCSGRLHKKMRKRKDNFERNGKSETPPKPGWFSWLWKFFSSLDEKWPGAKSKKKAWFRFVALQDFLTSLLDENKLEFDVNLLGEYALWWFVIPCGLYIVLWLLVLLGPAFCIPFVPYLFLVLFFAWIVRSVLQFCKNYADSLKDSESVRSRINRCFRTDDLEGTASKGEEVVAIVTGSGGGRCEKCSVADTISGSADVVFNLLWWLPTSKSTCICCKNRRKQPRNGAAADAANADDDSAIADSEKASNAQDENSKQKKKRPMTPFQCCLLMVLVYFCAVTSWAFCGILQNTQVVASNISMSTAAFTTKQIYKHAAKTKRDAKNEIELKEDLEKCILVIGVDAPLDKDGSTALMLASKEGVLGFDSSQLKVFDISMDSIDERKEDGGKGERQEKRGRKDGGKGDQEKKSYWKEAYLEEEDFPESELWNEDEIRIGRNIYIQVEDTWKLYKACMERIKTLEEGDERQRKLEQLEEEAGTNKQIYETLWGLARQRSRRYLKTRYYQASRVLESLAFNPDEEEEREERGKNKRQRTNYLS